MKINAKLLLLTFTIIAFITISSAIIYHSLTKELLLKQQSKNLVNSANDFMFTYQQFVYEIDDEFETNYKNDKQLFKSSNLDFAFSLGKDSVLTSSDILLKSGSKIFTDVNSVREFFDINKNLIKKQKIINGSYIFYGKVINANSLTTLAEKIRSDIAFSDNGVITYISNNSQNEQYLPALSKAARELNDKNDFEMYEESTSNIDLFVTHFSPKSVNYFDKELDFIVFSVSDEVAVFRNTMNIVTLLIVITGISLSIVFLFLFTAKFRKQLEYISNGVLAILEGKLDQRVEIISSDEIGNLGNAFNNMLDEIEKRDNDEKEYTEFISLINK
ncbi:MAG: HAMP domain-containing protein, partial [Ignavibacteriae bacterium]|nr:HAMP domain-containing protein [Ignavibacteriota bacterium]